MGTTFSFEGKIGDPYKSGRKHLHHVKKGEKPQTIAPTFGGGVTTYTCVQESLNLGFIG